MCMTSTLHRVLRRGKVCFWPMSPMREPRVTLARQGILVSEDSERLHLHLTEGSTHETDPQQPNNYQISTFDQTDIPIELPATENKSDEPIPSVR